jgi:hypothetical protein
VDTACGRRAEADRTYHPGITTVTVSQHGKTARFTAATEDLAPGAYLPKELEIDGTAKGAHIRIMHRLSDSRRNGRRRAWQRRQW